MNGSTFPSHCIIYLVRADEEDDVEFSHICK
jgi:hypothetical protein